MTAHKKVHKRQLFAANLLLHFFSLGIFLEWFDYIITKLKEGSQSHLFLYFQFSRFGKHCSDCICNMQCKNYCFHDEKTQNRWSQLLQTEHFSLDNFLQRHAFAPPLFWRFISIVIFPFLQKLLLPTQIPALIFKDYPFSHVREMNFLSGMKTHTFSLILNTLFCEIILVISFSPKKLDTRSSVGLINIFLWNELDSNFAHSGCQSMLLTT